MHIYTIHTHTHTQNQVNKYVSGFLLSVEMIPRCKQSWSPLILFQESWQGHIWIPGYRTLSPALLLVCAHTRIVLDSLHSHSFPMHLSSSLFTCAYACTHTEQWLFSFILPFLALSFLSFVFPLSSLHSFFSLFFSNLCSDSTNESFPVHMKSLFIWMQNLGKNILLNICVFTLRFEPEEKELSLIEWHSGQRNMQN